MLREMQQPEIPVPLFRADKERRVELGRALIGEVLIERRLEMDTPARRLLDFVDFVRANR